jgi:N-acetylmuramoyl-L-alanine amidase
MAWMLALVAGTVHAGQARIERLALSVAEPETRLTVTLSEPRDWRSFTLSSPDRLVIDIKDASLAGTALPLPAGAGAIHQLRAANRPDRSVRVVLDLDAKAEPLGVTRRASGSDANQIVLTLTTRTIVQAPVAATQPQERQSADDELGNAGRDTPAVPVQEESATPVTVTEPLTEPLRPASPEAPLVGRDVVIAIDAGHGGKDPGAHGPRGVREKDVTLRLARRLAAIIDEEPGMRAVLTRNRDEFVPLRSRMERARAAKADLFISVHADAVRNRAVRGASVYVLNEKGATDEAARRLAARENAADLIGGVTLGDKDRTLASVLMDLSQNAALGSSVEVGDAILAELARVGEVRKPRVMQAPFMVLKSPDVPSVLVETAYISNPEDERLLDSNGFRERLAQALYVGVRNYFYRNPPRGSLVAELSRRQVPGAVRHIARRGESLSAIASRYNTSVSALRAVNGLTHDRIVIGQVLLIPTRREI